MDPEFLGGQLPICIDLLQQDDSSLIEVTRRISISLSDAKALMNASLVQTVI